MSFEKQWEDDLAGFPKAQLVDQIHVQWKFRGCTLATSVLAVLISIAAIVVGVLAYVYLQYHIAPAIIRGSGPIPSSPYVFYVDAAGAPAAMILPNDLSEYVGKVYRIFSRTSQPHTLQLSGTGNTFDGIGSTVQFGGAIGNGLVFEVIAPNFVVVHVAKNVVII